MIRRLVFQSLRFHSSPAPVQTIIQHSFSRTFAKHNKPKRTNDYKNTPRGPLANQHDPSINKSRGPLLPTAERYSADPSPPNIQPADSGSSPLQVELRSDKISDSETQFSSVGKEHGLSKEDSTQPNFSRERSSGQDAFDPSTSSHGNKTPHSSPTITTDSVIASEKQQNQIPPLPDLTRGIPSTLDSDVAGQTSSHRTSPTSLNITGDPAQASGGGRVGGDLPNSAYISSLERRRNRIANFMYATILGMSIFGTIYLGRNWDTEDEEKKHQDAPNGWGLGLFYYRANARLRDMLDYYNEPAFPKLLPKPDPIMERPYTLVLSLEDLLVHGEWTREHGWRSAKRPGVDYFLRYLSQYYELVIFTSVSSNNADPIIRKLDPFRIVMWPLFREATRFRNGEYIKDLSYLNRDLSKVILIDTVEAHAKLQPENAIILPKWKGDPQDKELVSLIPFLEYVATMGFNDTREVLKSFEGTHIPTEFARREAIARERFQSQQAGERAKRPRRSGVGMLGNALGIKPMGTGLDGMEQSLSEGFEQGKTYQDQVRERGQRQYEIIEKEIRENGDKWLAEMAQEEEKMKAETMKGMKSSFLGFFGAGGGK